LSGAGVAESIAAAVGADRVALGELRPLAGGAVRRHWLLEIDITGGVLAGPQRLVLRGNGATPLGIGHDLAQEFALLQAVHGVGIAVPLPILYCADASLLGTPFHVTRWCPGTADPAALVAAGPNEALAAALGGELAAIQRVRPTMLGPPPADAARARLDQCRHLLDVIGEPRPAAEWGFRWLQQNVPPPAPAVLSHGDFRTGNYLVEQGGLSAILDWEFAQWGDPDEDLGWFCSRCWRFGALAREAGGIASRSALLNGYERVAGRRVDTNRLRYWEATAALRWLVIALLQRDRFMKAGERSLDLALTGRRAAECEFELLRLAA
jgi:aminoglycoside phosphotransferase (APT) family kinase protein